jgi:hypothetical protein
MCDASRHGEVSVDSHGQELPPPTKTPPGESLESLPLPADGGIGRASVSLPADGARLCPYPPTATSGARVQER